MIIMIALFQLGINDMTIFSLTKESFLKLAEVGLPIR